MAYIGKKPEDAFRGLAYYDTFTGDGSTTTFDLSADAPDGGQNDITVVVDNVRQEPGASKSYTLGLDGSSRYRRVTFNTAPDNLSEIYVINPGRSTSLVQVSDNTISAAKLQTDAVTTAKIQDSAVTNDKLAGSIANAKLANSSITINGTSIALGASGEIVAGTDWQALTVADGSTELNTEAGKGYFLDTNAGVIEVFLPTSPTRGDTIILMDYAGTFATNQVIVNTGGANLDSTSTVEYKLTTNDTIAEFIYVDSAKGWVTRINTTTGTTPSGAFNAQGGYDTLGPFIEATGGTVTTSGDYKIHTFTGDGCFVVTNQGTPAGSTQVDYLVVAGGGASGADNAPSGTGGGGGGGGFRYSAATYCSPVCAPGHPLRSPTGITITATTYPITVGAGGAATPLCCAVSTKKGSDSIFSTITSTGGGGGGQYGSSPTFAGGPGGSGGGTTGEPPFYPGGTGNTPPTSPPQGNNGGLGADGSPSTGKGGGGGGGATAVGGNATLATSTGNGGAGAGVPNAFGTSGENCGSYYYFSGGGGGGLACAMPATGGCGGIGGGGDAGNPGPNPAQLGQAGTANTGGGGGGNKACISSTGQAGGKGIVIIRYKFQ